MTVSVPANDISNAIVLQNRIASYKAVGTADALQRAEAESRDLVNTLLDQGKLRADLILSTVSYNSNHPVAAPLSATITALQTKIAAFNSSGQTALANGLSAHELPAAQAQLVHELINSGLVPASTILSHPSVSYIGSAPSR
jgi:hypothetical protein